MSRSSRSVRGWLPLVIPPTAGRDQHDSNHSSNHQTADGEDRQFDNAYSERCHHFAFRFGFPGLAATPLVVFGSSALGSMHSGP